MHKSPETVTASEIGEWAFCPEALRPRLSGAPSVNQLRKDAGTRHHCNLGRAERVAGSSIALGRWLIAAALIVLGLPCATL
jgi:hypothetical protein